MVPLLISVFPAGTVRDFVESAVNVLFSGIVPESSSVLPCILYSVPVTDTLPEAWSFKAVLFQAPYMPYLPLPVPLTVKSPSCASRETSVQEDANTAVLLVLVMLRDFPAVAVIIPLPYIEPVTEMASLLCRESFPLSARIFPFTVSAPPMLTSMLPVVLLYKA